MNKKLKIVHTMSSFSSGGAETLIRELALQQAKTEEVEVWAMNPSRDKNFEKDLLERFAKANIKTELVGEKPRSERLKKILRIRKLINERKPDAINAHSEAHAAFLAMASMDMGANLFQTVHSTVINFRLLQKYYTTPFLKKYIAISAKCKEIIARELAPPDKKIQVIYNGIDLGRFRCADRKIRPEVKNILILGRLAPEKDHANMLHAFRMLCDKLKSELKPVPKLNIVGDGQLRAPLESLVKELALNDNVIFHGVKLNIPEILLENDLLVMSSKWEGLSIALLEAVASGIPIIATDVGSNNEIVYNDYNGRLVEKENSEQLADAIYGLMSNPEKRAEYSANSSLVADKYDIKITADSYNSLYREAIIEYEK